MPAVFNNGNVDVDDVTVFQDFFIARNTVADHFVYRDTNGFRIAVIPQAGRDRLLFLGNVIITDTIEFTGANTGNHVWLDNF